jgi:hypothetical protein
MSMPDLSVILDECIHQMQKGATLEQVLARHPDDAAELEKLLAAAGAMHAARTGIEIPLNAQARSRMAFINSAYQPIRTHSLFHAFHLKFATALLSILALLAFGLLGTTLASAHTLPGDVFYPVKLALEQVQMNFTTAPAQRLQLQQNFDDRRAEEVNELKQAGRSSAVSFIGELVRNGDRWQVAGITLDLNSQQEAQAAGWANYVVQVTGELEGMTVHVSALSIHLLTINGKIQQIRSNSWLVDGVKITLNSETDIVGDAAVGSSVQITGRRAANGQIMALTADVAASNLVRLTGDPAGEVQGETLSPSATYESDSNGESGEPNSPGGGGDQNPSRTPRPTATPHADGEEKTPTATEVMNSTPFPSPSATVSDQHGDEDKNPTRTRVIPTQETPSQQTPTLVSPSMTPTPTGQNSENDPGEHSHPSRTPTPTQTP